MKLLLNMEECERNCFFKEGREG